MIEPTIEQEIQAKASMAPRVMPADIEAEIVSEHYFTAAQGEAAANDCFGELGDPGPKCLELLTFCVLVLKNGFTVTGESACASPENFNADIGRHRPPERRGKDLAAAGLPPARRACPPGAD